MISATRNSRRLPKLPAGWLKAKSSGKRTRLQQYYRQRIAQRHYGGRTGSRRRPSGQVSLETAGNMDIGMTSHGGSRMSSDTNQRGCFDVSTPE